MRFIEFTREVTDVQMPDVAPVILPQMYKIFTMAEVLYSAYKNTVQSLLLRKSCRMYVIDKNTVVLLLLQVYSIRTRSRAVEIFTTCANLICAIDEVAKVKFQWSTFVYMWTGYTLDSIR